MVRDKIERKIEKRKMLSKSQGQFTKGRGTLEKYICAKLYSTRKILYKQRRRYKIDKRPVERKIYMKRR